ncbi:MAG: Extracellular solute-binding protein family 5 [Parcubacteria group bacterium Gr01-1014_17]|nr:MAG: Extracellular solute-binding protein family 5 [Parcubacteria group bacterium Gr01-1014_17]
MSLPFFERLDNARHAFSKTERLFFGVLCALLAASTLALVAQANNFFLIEIPRRGGVFTEGIIGTPRFINPILAASDADRDLTALVYAGLLKATSEGDLVQDLAERYEISEDNRSYTFWIKPSAVFHDGAPVTADDVLFTIQKAQDPLIKSVKRANWEGVAAEKLGEREVRLTLKRPYAPFLENASLGILPKHLWKNIDAESFQFNPLNGVPVGAGPYRIIRVDENASRVPTAVTLAPFEKYTLDAPYIERVILRFYGNEITLLDAFSKGEIESMGGISPSEARALQEKGVRAIKTPLPRVFGIFFNQNQSKVLADKAVRFALEKAIDKNELVNNVLGGYGTPIDGPIPERIAGVSENTATDDKTTDRIAEARAILEGAKWKLNTDTGMMEKKDGKETRALSFSLATASTPELKKAAEFAVTAWRVIGAQVELKFFDISDLNQTVIRPRAYDALLFGEIVGRDLDLFAFWHSSQRNDPGLNIALYTSIKADRLLEEARTAQEKEKRDEALRAFAEELRKDAPAVFLYSPDFIYILPEKIKNMPLGRLSVPHERFLNIHRAYINTEKVWPFFTKN